MIEKIQKRYEEALQEPNQQIKLEKLKKIRNELMHIIIDSQYDYKQKSQASELIKLIFFSFN